MAQLPLLTLRAKSALYCQSRAQDIKVHHSTIYIILTSLFCITETLTVTVLTINTVR